MSEQLQEVIATPDVADGNPSTAMSLVNQLKDAGGAPLDVRISAFSKIIEYRHKRITTDPDAAVKYTHDSEQERLNLKARIGSRFLFAEFAGRLLFSRYHNVRLPSRLNLVQEHTLIGASPRALEALNITEVRVVVPDVFPKESAKYAVRNMPGATFVVWNRDAFDELVSEGFKVELSSPFILDGLRPDSSEFHNSGMNVVAKSSGSGMPPSWQMQLHDEFAKLHDTTWSLHTPKGSTSHEFEVMEALSKAQRIQNYYNCLGGNTVAMINFPTELAGVAFAMRERGVPVWVITFPPRGAHEKRNLRFLLDHNLVLGQLMPDGYTHPPEFEDLPLIPMSQLHSVIQNLPEPMRHGGRLGTKPIWSGKVA